MTPSPSPSVTDPSTVDPADDESLDDGAVPADDGNTPDQPFTLSPQMAASAGLDGLKPGDSFAVMIHGTVTDNTDGTITADLEDAMGGKKTQGDAEMPPPAKKPSSRVLGPVEAGIQSEDGKAIM